MIKYLGTVGLFLHPSSSEDRTYNLLNIYSSSVEDTEIFHVAEPVWDGIKYIVVSWMRED